MKKDTLIRHKIAIVCFGLAFLPLILVGLRFIFIHSFIPYHAVALGTEWSELPSPYQILYLAQMKVAGGGILSAGIAGEIILFLPFQRKENWSRWTLLIIGLIVGGLTLMATLSVKLNTPASPPWILTSCCIILILTGFFLSSGMTHAKNSGEKDLLHSRFR
jgi:hypothetical protein